MKHIINIKSILTVLIISICLQNAYTQNIAIDNTFGNNGVSKIAPSNVNPCTLFKIDHNRNVYSACINYSNTTTLRITKLSPNGLLDNQFGINGLSTLFQNVTHLYSIDILNNSKILVCIDMAITTTTSPITCLVKLNVNGSIDNTFGNNGIVEINNPTSHPAYLSLTDNSILISKIGGVNNSETVLFKLNENGIINTQFGVNGYLTLSSNSFPFSILSNILTMIIV